MRRSGILLLISTVTVPPLLPLGSGSPDSVADTPSRHEEGIDPLRLAATHCVFNEYFQAAVTSHLRQTSNCCPVHQKTSYPSTPTGQGRTRPSSWYHTWMEETTYLHPNAGRIVDLHVNRYISISDTDQVRYDHAHFTVRYGFFWIEGCSATRVFYKKDNHLKLTFSSNISYHTHVFLLILFYVVSEQISGISKKTRPIPT